ncbi:hypothetical protein DDE82_001534 [Stemphylium lycopersici]|uniref:F-box domain-containing protein n=1 Tax=Stemphylium lycopersici TaxID=183478 RepID=A0A364NGU1_STELY|nr:f-box domain-containing cyclin-like protein [Stemphylium lycopersici]RAR09817.1 hypothetical protein DDE82_001534 [Stemphylium lycopersici]RAR16466.1 hypothetical protein DDE83_000031 [Stemphylium lycopersici]
MPALDTLPNEILSLITNHLDRPRDVLHLSLTCRRLCEFAKLDGWKALLKGRFGLGGLDSDARNSVHGLTTLYRNWNRRGLVAAYLEPTDKATNMNTWRPERWRGPQGQTMGYQPSIDSYEEIYGGWAERREVLAWSAGTHIVMRIKETGASVERIRQREEGAEQATDQTWAYDNFKHLNTWFTYKIPDSFEGRDDITNLKLLRPHQRDMAHEDIMFGTASGELSLLSVNPDLGETQLQQYDTAIRGINDFSVSSLEAPMVAAALADSSLALYSLNRDHTSQEIIAPSSEVKTILDAPFGRLWSCQFLSDDKVAVGWGPSTQPILVYHIGPDGLSSEPFRCFDMTTSNGANMRPTSVYPILPIPHVANSGSEGGNTFLSGSYDGLIRLHDMRSPNGFEQTFWDPTNDSPVYSLASQGLERIVAGVALHSMIKVFDLRLSGSNAYHTIPIPPDNQKKTTGSQNYVASTVFNRKERKAPTTSGGWNLYLNPRVPPPRNAYLCDYSRVREDSPVYSLSIPSATSQNVYAGLEGAVESLTFHGIADRHPDPMLSNSVTRFRDSGIIDPRASYDPKHKSLNLGMYEQGTEEGLGMQLLVQDGVTSGAIRQERREAALKKSLDERWIDLRDEGNRWARGETPRREQGRGQRQGRGRGREGRGRGRAAQ